MNQKKLLKNYSLLSNALCDNRLVDKNEQGELQELWEKFKDLSDREKIQREAREFMKIDDVALRDKENDLELLIRRLNEDENEIKNSSKVMKLLQETYE